MTIGDNMDELAGLPVRDWSSGDEITDPEKTAFRITVDYELEEEGILWMDLFHEFVELPGADKVKALIVGAWGPQATAQGAEMVDDIVQALVSARDRLPSLQALFFGDITFEECEISWINQSNVSPVLTAYQQLRYFGVRGGQGLSLGGLKHPNLRHLVIETGGLPVSVVREIGNSDLPELEHLEIWFGSETYGADYELTDVEPIVSGDKFPKLKYLGLRNSEQSDGLAGLVAHSPILERLEVLDLSMGLISDEGAGYLLESPHLAKLRRLDLHHNYFSEMMLKRLKRLPIDVNVDENEQSAEDDRYIAVSE